MYLAYYERYAYGLIKAMPPRQNNLAQNRAIPIPQRVQQEMAQHMQKTLPANLQYYQKSGAYVPPHIQQQMTQHMQETMPEHLKQYISPYMQQQVKPQHLAPPPTAGGMEQPAHFNVRHTPLALGPNQLPPQQAVEPQPTAQPQPFPAAQTPSPAGQPQAPVSPEGSYAFITNAQNTAKTPSLLSTLNGKSLPLRFALLGGGLVVLLVLFSIIKGLLTPGFTLQPFIAVLQDQQELIHLTTNAVASPAAASLPASYQNFVATTQASVTSSEGQLMHYLLDNKQKIKPQELGLKINPTTDTQLTNSAASNTYMSELQQVMSSQLTTYMSDLHSAYLKTSGKKGHIQLSNDYNQALLLTKQLNEAANAAGAS
jgi:hypothetical protein